MRMAGSKKLKTDVAAVFSFAGRYVIMETVDGVEI
jgi:hypothetical protein|nr:MAG TPA: hypothetical protein [Caudoviricetes sp.]